MGTDGDADVEVGAVRLGVVQTAFRFAVVGVDVSDLEVDVLGVDVLDFVVVEVVAVDVVAVDIVEVNVVDLGVIDSFALCSGAARCQYVRRRSDMARLFYCRSYCKSGSADEDARTGSSC